MINSTYCNHLFDDLLDALDSDDVAGGSEDGDRRRVAEDVVGDGANVALVLGNEAALLPGLGVVLVTNLLELDLDEVLHSKRLARHGTVDSLVWLKCID